MSTVAAQTQSVAQLSFGALIIVASWMIGFVLIGGSLFSLVHVSSAIVVAAGPIMFVLISRSNKSWNTSSRAEQIRNLSNAAIASGVIGTIIALVKVMENLDKLDQIGVGIAVAILAMLYGLVAHFLMMAFVTEETSPQKQITPKTDLAIYGLLSFAFLMVVTVFVFYALDISHVS